MIQKDWKNIIESIGLAAIVASLILVAMELRQNTAVATANALSQSSAALDASYRARAQDPILAALIMKGHADYVSLSELEQNQFAAWLRADMNHLEAIWIYYDLGLLSEEAFDGFEEAICGRLTTDGGRQYWKDEAKFFASGFQTYVSDWCNQ